VVQHRRLEQGRRALRGRLELTLELREFYEAGYSLPDAAEAERLGRWRALGARSKAAHVRALCKKTGLRPRSLVDIGCGDGALLAALRGFAPVMDGFELSAPAAELARQNVPEARRIEAFDGLELPVEDGAYDLAVLSHVIEHVPNPVPLLAEAARVAHEVLIEVPLEDNRSARRPAKRAEAARIGHVHELDRAEVKEIFQEAGLVFEADLTDPLPYAHHAFFADGATARAAAAGKWALRRAVHRLRPLLAERWFTVHYAVLTRRP
jgi:SAM-dependent methyltransferase